MFVSLRFLPTVFSAYHDLHHISVVPHGFWDLSMLFISQTGHNFISELSVLDAGIYASNTSSRLNPALKFSDIGFEFVYFGFDYLT